MSTNERSSIFQNSLRKKDRCSASLALYPFSSTHFINSIKHEHLCKIIYFSELNHLCGTTLTNLTGVISSPDLDNDGEYENMMECSWIIKAVESHVIILQFLEINLEKNPYVGVRTCMDYVKVCYMYFTIVSKYDQEIPQS